MQLSLLPREITPETVLAALSGRVGEANGISASALSLQITGRHSAADERRLRTAIVKLRLDGYGICAMPESGYFMASTAEELNRACVFLAERGITTFQQIAAMKRVALPDLYGQLGLPAPDHSANDESQGDSE